MERNQSCSRQLCCSDDLLFAVARLLSFWADLLSFLLVVYLLSFRRNFAYPVVPTVEVSFENLDIVFGVILLKLSVFRREG